MSLAPSTPRLRLSLASTVLLLVLLVAWFWLRGERFIAANGPTFDEGVHLTAGYSYWMTGDFRLNAEDPPLLKLLWALPAVLGSAPQYPELDTSVPINHWQVADRWIYGSGISPRSLIDPARRVNLALGCCTIVLVGWWAFRFWGSLVAALAASAFAAADPNLLAFSCVLSTDLGLAFFSMLTCYFIWEYVATPTRGLLLATGISLGLMLAAKFSALGIVVGLTVAGWAYYASGGTLALPGTQQPKGLRSALELGVRLGVIAAIAAAATYGFIHFDQWGKGLKFQLTRGEHGDGVMYLDGELSQRGWLQYFIVVLLLKLPVGLLLCSALATMRGAVGLAVRAPRDAGVAAVKNPQLWVIVPPIAFFALASYSRVDMGLRVVAPVLPFLYLLAAGLASVEDYRILSRTVVVACLIWSGYAAQSANPHEIAYHNELAGSLTTSTPILADSNLDWGQGLPSLKAWMNANAVDRVYLAFFGTDRPEAHGIRFAQLPSYGRIGPSASEAIPSESKRHIVAVSINHLYGLFLNDPELYSFLRQREPLSTLDGSMRVFDLSDDPDARARIRAQARP
jgi:hypothetical protein